ncbi:Pol-polyprotein [Rhynchospora pubera]|uniref:Pol-polyprotein n=1 Tax=Rhynchospora pubera TaxID=906938 RepID=A0AAV8GIK0_9POAL|nr:Pol-polyprotein [Rhynchospora pubera]
MDTPLVGFAGDTVIPLGTIDLEVEFGEPPNSVISKVKFIVVNAPSAYNVILERKSLNDVGAIASTKHLMIKFPTRLGVGVVKGDQQKARECYQAAVIDQVELSEGITNKLGTALGAKDRELVKECLKRNQEIFVAEGGQMPGIRREIAEHKIKPFPNARPVHQKKKKFGPERRTIIEEEVQRLLAAGFIREVKCPAWLANPLVVLKPNNKWRVCIDFTDLNKACPKDPFPLPNIDALVDSTVGFSHLSIVDANAGYHQIKMCTEDEEKTSFLTEKGIYCYKVMPFGLKNAGAEYQRMLNKLFQDEIGKIMEAYVDDMLVVNQIKGEYAAINERLALYLEKVKTVLAAFESASVEYVPRTQNETADALSKIAKESDLDREKPIVMLEVPHPSIDVLAFEVYIVEAGKEWYALLWNFLKEGELPEEDKVARKVKRWALEFTIRDGLLLKKGYGIPWLTCVGRAKADKIIAEVHEGICGSHQGITSLGRRIVRAGFYWPSLKKDVETYVHRCEKCQFHARIPRQPPHPMQSISSSWPFDVWGLDLLGPFPQGQGNVKFLVVAVEYFTKWIEAKPLATIASQKIVDFARHQIVYRYGIPHTFISDNGTQFTGAPFQDFCKGLGIRSCTSSVCHPQSNGLAEVSNRTILEGLKRKIESSKNTWPEYLDEILWAYRTTPRSSTSRSPFSMIYGMEAVTPMEAVHPTLRTKSYTWEKNGTRREEDLETIYELREEARVKMEEYQRRMRRGFDRKVAPKHFQPGDWVLRKIEATGKQVGKFDPAWEDPFEIIKSIEGRAYHLRDMRGKRIPNVWNAAHLRKFYI